MRFSLLLAVGLLTVCLPHGSIVQQVPCPPVGITTNSPTATNPGGQLNIFNWYYGDYQLTTYSGRMYTLRSTAYPSQPDMYLL